VRGTSAETEQRAPQSERLPQPQRRSPEWNEAGAERFAGPFVTMRRSRTQRNADGWRLRSEAEPACHGGAVSHLGDLWSYHQPGGI
jgi:hypothetical protein